MEPWLGAGVVRRTGWKVDCKAFELWCRSFLILQGLLVGLCLRSNVEKRNRGSVCSWVSMLNPSIAYLLLRIARLQPEDVICDPMAGVATIAIEAVQAFGRKT